MTDRELMQMALDAMENGCVYGGKQQVAMQALRERLAQPEPWVKTYCGGKPNYTTQPEPEPVVKYSDVISDGGFDPRYTAPPKREWVGLTDKEVGGLTVFDGLTHIEVPILADYIRVIEARLREKNT